MRMRMSEKTDEKTNETTDENTGFFDKPGNVRRMLRIFYAACVILVLLDLFSLRHTEEARPWEGFFAFYVVYGFVACTLLVLIAKVLRKVLMREEDYYDR